MATAAQRRAHTARKIDLALTNAQLQNDGTKLLTTGEFLSGGVAPAPWHEFARCIEEVADETVNRWRENGVLEEYERYRTEVKGRELHRCEYRDSVDAGGADDGTPPDENPDEDEEVITFHDPNRAWDALFKWGYHAHVCDCATDAASFPISSGALVDIADACEEEVDVGGGGSGGGGEGDTNPPPPAWLPAWVDDVPGPRLAGIPVLLLAVVVAAAIVAAK